MMEEFDELIDVLERIDHPICPACDCDIAQVMGILGNLAHFRCASCGVEFSKEIPSD